MSCLFALALLTMPSAALLAEESPDRPHRMTEPPSKILSVQGKYLEGTKEHQWPEGSVSTSDDHTIANDDISVSHDFAHLRNMVFPRNVVSDLLPIPPVLPENTFLEYTDGGTSYALRYDDQITGPYHGGFHTEGFEVHSDSMLTNREYTEDGLLSIVTAAAVNPDGGAYFTVSYWIRNQGDVSTSLKIYDYTEPNANSQDQEITKYDPESGVISSTNYLLGANAILGSVPCTGSTGHAIGDEDILGQIETGNLNNANYYHGNSWYIQSVEPGLLAPGETVQVDFVFRAAELGGSVDDAAEYCPSSGDAPVPFLQPPPPLPSRPPNENDDFSGRINIPSVPYTNEQSTKEATMEPDEPEPCGYIYNTVWYEITVSEESFIVMDTFGSAFDTVLAAYTGDGLADLALVQCNDDFGPGTFQSQIGFTAEAETPYRIQVGGYNGDVGDLVIHAGVFIQPVNDDKEDSLTIEWLPYVNSQNTIGATVEPDEPDPCGGIASTVWFSYTPNFPQYVTVDTFGSDYDTVLAAYIEVDGVLVELDCNDDSDGSLRSEINFVSIPGVTVYLQAGGYFGHSGTLVLNANGFY